MHDVKGVSELGNVWWRGIGWGDLHLMACISLTSFQHAVHEGGGGQEIRFGILKNQGVVQIGRATGKETRGDRGRGGQ